VSLLRIGELARRSGVSVPTVKHYLREGLIRPARRTGRTMAWYAPSDVERIRAIKELQQHQYLPLDVIKQALAKERAAPDELAAATAIADVLARHRGTRSRSRAELIGQGVDARHLDWLAAAGLAVPSATDGCYRDDDLALLATLGAARRAGISADMLPFGILGEYLVALRHLVEVELALFRDGVLARADRSAIPALAAAATELSERLVVLLRRKLLLPTLTRIVQEERREVASDHRARRVSRRTRTPRRRRREGDVR
jgi:DNA-binding transcriptional MerR regulator